jgi:hypothetical protein
VRTHFIRGVIVAIAAITVFSSAGLAQTGEVARRARPKSNLPFDPHDLVGVWSRTGGDRGMSSRPGVDVPPMTPAAQKLFDASGPGYGPRAVPPAKGNDIVGECNPQGIPRLLYFPRPVEFIQLPNRLIQYFQWHHVLREIWTDGRKPPEDPDTLRWYGYSSAHWEGNVFVVDSTGFDDRTWLDMYGYPHSEQMKLQERYERVDHDTIEMTVIVNDPKMYTKPWVSQKKTWSLLPKPEEYSLDGWNGLPEEVCAPIDEVTNFNNRVRDPAGGVIHK